MSILTFSEFFEIFVFLQGYQQKISASLNQKPAERDFCGQRLSQLFRHVAVFEPIVGNIGGLPSSPNWRLE